MHNSTALSSALAPVKRRIPSPELIVSLLSLSGHSVTYCTKLGVPPPVFHCSSNYFCDDVLWLWCSFLIGCFDILFLFDLFWCLWSLVLFWFLFMVWCFYGCQLMFSFCVSHFCAEMFCCFVSNSIGWIICPLERQKIPLINQQGWITNPPVPDC